MELKNAAGVCLISFFSATLVVLIARSLDSQAALRLEPQLARIVQELEAIRTSGRIALDPASRAGTPSPDHGLVVYYFHGNTRCPTCRAIELQAQDAIQTYFASQLSDGQIVWKVVNYEESAAADLVKKFEIQVPVVVIARMKGGQIADWTRLDKVWQLVGEPSGFAQYVEAEVTQMLKPAVEPSAEATPAAAPAK